jgi:hypothetical protein
VVALNLLSLLGNDWVNIFPRQGRLLECNVFYMLSVSYRRQLFNPRISCLSVWR